MRIVIEILWKNRILLRETSRQDIEDRYAGNIFGVVWFVIQPLLTMVVFIFVFVFALRMRMPETAALDTAWGGYVMYLLSGLVPWMSLQEIMNRSVTAITSSANMVKQVIFPVEILPAKMILSMFLVQVISLAVYFLFGSIRYGLPPLSVVLLPLVIGSQMMLSLGIALLFSALTPFFRDLKDVVQMLCFIIMYSLPIFYTPQMIPEQILYILMINPFFHIIVCWHDAIYWGNCTMLISWIIFPLFSLFVFAVGARAFLSLKNLFGNVL